MRSCARGIASLLASVPDLEVVGEAGDGREALAILERIPADVVILDITMPGMNGLEAASRVAERWPATKVIILSMHSNEEYVSRALRAGAAGYLLKDAGTSELEGAIRAVVRGQTFLSAAVSRRAPPALAWRRGRPRSRPSRRGRGKSSS